MDKEKSKPKMPDQVKSRNSKSNRVVEKFTCTLLEEFNQIVMIEKVYISLV